MLKCRCEVCGVTDVAGPGGIKFFSCPACPKHHRVCDHCLYTYDLLEVSPVRGPWECLRECASDTRVVVELMGRRRR